VPHRTRNSTPPLPSATPGNASASGRPSCARRPGWPRTRRQRPPSPGFYIGPQGKDVAGLVFLHSSRARLPENSFQVGGGANSSRYMNAELDGLIDAYFRTIPMPERVSVLGRIIRHMAEQVPVMGLYCSGAPYAFANRLSNVSTRDAGGSGTNPAGTPTSGTSNEC